jgi:hypothetical protein
MSRIADDLREMSAEPGEVPITGTQWDVPTAEQRRLAGLPEKPERPLRPAWKTMLDAVDPHGSSSTST